MARTPKPTLADQLADRFVAHDINLMRLQASQRRTMVRALTQLERELERNIRRYAGVQDTVTRLRSRALLTTVRQTIKTAYDKIEVKHEAMLKDLGAYEATAAGRLVNRAVGANLMAVGIDDKVLDSMLDEKVVKGTPLKSFWNQQSETTFNNFAREMRAGIFAGETPQQLIQRVRGTKAQGFRDGIMQTSRRGAEVVTRTAAQSILNDARMETYRENADVIDGVQAQVVFDDRTTEICMARSGFAWDLDGNPLPGTETDEPFPGPPPWHPNCRSTLIPVVKSLADLIDNKQVRQSVKRELGRLPKSTQASMNGQIAGDLTYEQWLETKSVAFQKEVLGEGRYALWQKEQISLRDLIDQRGNPLTLAQLRELD